MIDSRDWAVIQQLQNGISRERRPFEYLAANAGIPVREFIARMLRLKKDGIIRRMGARVRQREMGWQANALAVWCVPPHEVERVGTLFASLKQVSHCYTRTTAANFPYNLYTMVHALTWEELDRLISHMAHQSGIQDYRVLRTLRELKKSTPRYHPPGDPP
ncbi:MAG: siroheme decarboxylase subunit beta [Candidatus Zipacnadales bacterium]